ncbi:MAG TPA: hypothetical protein VFQ32_04305 [Ktedonobacterales bacterium]|nr:hypothetical protein [Ktedonobacterales bacterium]
MNWRLKWRRSWRQIIGAMAAVAAAGMLLGGAVGLGDAPMARAASATSHTATMPLYGIPHETGKVTLPELSIDGPALWTQGQPSAPVGPMMVLAWTGTDHRLNYMFGNGGIHSFISGSKKILSETSFVRPSVVRGIGSGGFTAPVALAWIGTDSGHHLNVLYSVPGSTARKLTLWNDTSFTSPSLEWLNVSEQGGTLLLAWAGTDAGHSLNIMQVHVTSQGLTQGSKATYWNYHSAGQPELIQDRTFSSPFLYFLGWSDVTSHRITWAVSSDAKTWTQQPSFAEMSGSGPSLMGLNEELTHFPPFWMARAGTGADTSHHVNVLYALSYTEATTNNTKATLPETALGGPVVGFNLYQPGEELIVAWTGTDALHHVNLATLSV